MALTAEASGSLKFQAVNRASVDPLVHASDNFQLALGFGTLDAGALIGLLVALAAGAIHPLPVYFGIAISGVATLILGGIAARLFLQIPRLRQKMDAETEVLTVTVQLS